MTVSIIQDGIKDKIHQCRTNALNGHNAQVVVKKKRVLYIGTFHYNRPIVPSESIDSQAIDTLWRPRTRSTAAEQTTSSSLNSASRLSPITVMDRRSDDRRRRRSVISS